MTQDAKVILALVEQSGLYWMSELFKKKKMSLKTASLVRC